MPSTFGTTTANIFYKLPMQAGLTQKFTPAGLSYTITFSTALITGNVVLGYVKGIAVTRTYATSSAATLALITADINAIDGVKSATLSSLVITVIPDDQDAGITIVGFAETGGSSQGTITVAAVDYRVYAGMPVQILTDGTIAPADPTAMNTTNIGTCLDKDMKFPDGSTKTPIEVTVKLNGLAIVEALSYATQNAGPVAYSSWDTATGKNIYTTSGVTAATLAGWSMDKVTGAKTAIRVIQK